MASASPFILDTNIALVCIRGGALAGFIEQTYQIRTSPMRPLISAVSIGELHALALKRKWSAKKRDTIGLLEKELVVLDIYRPEIINFYAEIDAATELKGKKLSKNDLWIAATAKATHSVLLTTDKDFDPLHPNFIERIWIDPAAGRVS